MSLTVIRDIPKYLEDYLKGTPSLGFGEILKCSTLYTEYEQKQPSQLGYDDIRDVYEDGNVIAARWLEVHTDRGIFLAKAVPGYDDEEKGWLCYCKSLEGVADCMESGASRYYCWTITIPDVPEEFTERLVKVITDELVDEVFKFYGFPEWKTHQVAVFLKINTCQR